MEVVLLGRWWLERGVAGECELRDPHKNLSNLCVGTKHSQASRKRNLYTEQRKTRGEGHGTMEHLAKLQRGAKGPHTSG